MRVVLVVPPAEDASDQGVGIGTMTGNGTAAVGDELFEDIFREQRVRVGELASLLERLLIQAGVFLLLPRHSRATLCPGALASDKPHHDQDGVGPLERASPCMPSGLRLLAFYWFSATGADRAFAGRPKRSRTRRRKWRKLSMPKARHRMARRP